MLPSIERWFAQPALAIAGLVTLVLVPAGLAWSQLDHRLVHGEVVALKPTKFALSGGVYLLTVSWMLGYVRPERMTSGLVQTATWGLMVGASVELFCIILQAARGRASHFNLATPLDAAISGLMGVLAILFVGMLLPLAWEIGRRPRPDAPAMMVAAIVVGLVATFVLGALTGAGMGRIASGAVPSHEFTLPIVGWTLPGGWTRVAHFLGIHALQAFPMMAFAVSLLPGRSSWTLLLLAGLTYVAITLCALYYPPAARGGDLQVRPADGLQAG
jgi:hypothetical protein